MLVLTFIISHEKIIFPHSRWELHWDYSLEKQIGIYVFAGLTIKLNYANLPKNTTWLQLYGASILCGIGFTMSLFISMLAFGSEHQSIINSRLGILMGSLLSAIGGYLLILFATRSKTSF